MDGDTYKKLENAVIEMIELNDSDRTEQYGSTGWKLLVKRYVEESQQKYRIERIK